MECWRQPFFQAVLECFWTFIYGLFVSAPLPQKQLISFVVLWVVPFWFWKEVGKVQLQCSAVLFPMGCITSGTCWPLGHCWKSILPWEKCLLGLYSCCLAKVFSINVHAKQVGVQHGGWAVVVGNAVSVYTVGCVAGLLRLPRHVQPAFPVHRSWGNGRELHKAAFLVISAQISRDSWTEAVFTACSEGEVEWMVDLKKTIYTFLPICRQLVFVVVVWARKHLVMQSVWAL